MALFSGRNGESNVKRQETTPSLKYANMMANPGSAQPTRAPALTPYLASQSHIRRVLDVTASETQQGYGMVVMSPNAPIPYLESNLVPRIPTAGNATFSFVTNGAAYLNVNGMNATFQCTDGKAVIRSAYVTAGAVTLPAYELSQTTGNYALQFQQNSGTTLAYPQFVAAYGLVAGVWTIMSPVTAVIAAGHTVNITVTVPAAGATYFALITCDGAGTLLANSNATSARGIVRYYGFGFKPATVNSTASPPQHHIGDRIISLGDQEIVNHRIVAMSCLVTNMAASLNDSGRIVIGRSNANILLGSTVPEMQSSLAALPDVSRVYDGPLRDGGYAWYLPENLEDYEPITAGRPYSEDNSLVAIYNMDPTNGVIRIVIDYIVEFYTPNQLVQRDLSPHWDDQLMCMYRALYLEPAASANFAHAALISGALAAARKAVQIYAENKELIDPIVAATYRLVKKNFIDPALAPKQPVQSASKKSKVNPKKKS